MKFVYQSGYKGQFGPLVPVPAWNQEVSGSNPSSVAGGHQTVYRCVLRTAYLHLRVANATATFKRSKEEWNTKDVFVFQKDVLFVVFYYLNHSS